jgi:ubiquitin-conjugating enzyme E2 W
MKSIRVQRTDSNDDFVSNARVISSPLSKDSAILQLRGGKSKSIVTSIADMVMDLLRSVFPSVFPKAKGKKGKKSAAKQHLEKTFKAGDSNARLQREMREFINNPPGNLKLSVGSNIRSWVIHITGAEGTIFEGEKFKLKMNFPKEYPSKPPSVYFLKPTPKHVHVYTNGDICLSLLGKDWRPNMTAESLAVSILSMLSSAKQKSVPQDNALHADAAPGQQQDNWMYHDDKC